MKNKTYPLFFAALIFSLQPLAGAADVKIFGLGDKSYDVAFIGSALSANEMKWGSAADAVDGDPNDGKQRYLIVFQIERVFSGELSKVPRGGLSKWEQMKENKILGAFSLKDPNEMVPREKFRLALSNPGEAFGITPGQPLPSYQYKIYLKRTSRKPETLVFVRSEPVK